MCSTTEETKTVQTLSESVCLLSKQSHTPKSLSQYMWVLCLNLFTLVKLSYTTIETSSGENVFQHYKDFNILVPPPHYSR